MKYKFSDDIIYNGNEPDDIYCDYSIRNLYIRKSVIERILPFRMIGMNKDDMIYWINIMNIVNNISKIKYNDKHSEKLFIYFHPLSNIVKNYKQYDITRINAYILNTEMNISYNRYYGDTLNFIAPVNAVKSIPINSPYEYNISKYHNLPYVNYLYFITKSCVEPFYCGQLDNMCCIPIIGDVHDICMINRMTVDIISNSTNYDINKAIDILKLPDKFFNKIILDHICYIRFYDTEDKIVHEKRCRFAINSDNIANKRLQFENSIKHYKYYSDIINDINNKCVLYYGHQGKICYGYFVNENDRTSTDINIFDNNMNPDHTVSYNIYKDNSIKLFGIDDIIREGKLLPKGGYIDITKYVLLFILCLLLLICIVSVVLLVEKFRIGNRLNNRSSKYVY